MTIDPLSEDGLDLVGTELDGRYRIERYVGAGTMGSVYEATQLAVGRRVAVKILNQGLKTNSEVRERFRVEAQAIASLNHPNCITLFDFGYSDRISALFMVIEFLDGHTLEERLSLDVPVQEALAIGHQIADVLSQAHEAGILHRDLKPENVMLISGSGSSPVVKVLDFGLARIFQDGGSNSVRLTRQGQLFGTPAYMSPEQCAGAVNVGPAADVYALGVTLYEMLGGFLPFVSESIAELLVMHSKQPPPQLVCDAEPEVIELVMNMLSKDPGQRPTAPEVAEALRAYSALAGHAPAHPRRSAISAEVVAPKARRAPGETDELEAGEHGQEKRTFDTILPPRRLPVPLLALLALLVSLTVGAIVAFQSTDDDADAGPALVQSPATTDPQPAEPELVDETELEMREAEQTAAKETAEGVAALLATKAGHLADAEALRPDAGSDSSDDAHPRPKQAKAASQKKRANDEKASEDSKTIRKLNFRY